MTLPISAVLSALDRAEKAATPGPFTAKSGGFAPRVLIDGQDEYWTLDNHSVQVWQCDDELDGCPDIAREWMATAELFALTRTHLRAVLDHVAALESERDEALRLGTYLQGDLKQARAELARFVDEVNYLQSNRCKHEGNGDDD